MLKKSNKKSNVRKQKRFLTFEQAYLKMLYEQATPEEAAPAADDAAEQLTVITFKTADQAVIDAFRTGFVSATFNVKNPDAEDENETTPVDVDGTLISDIEVIDPEAEAAEQDECDEQDECNEQEEDLDEQDECNEQEDECDEQDECNEQEDECDEQDECNEQEEDLDEQDECNEQEDDEVQECGGNCCVGKKLAKESVRRPLHRRPLHRR